MFLVREGGVKLLDFGLAKLLRRRRTGGSEAATATATDRGTWMGTPGYVSPEQLRGQGATARSDMFALGAVLYEMLTGQRAFKGATKADMLAAILEKDPPAMALRRRGRSRRRSSEWCGGAWRRTRTTASSRRGTWRSRWRRSRPGR